MACPDIDKIFRWMSVDIYRVLTDYTQDQWKESHAIWSIIPTKKPPDIVIFMVYCFHKSIKDTPEASQPFFREWCTRWIG